MLDDLYLRWLGEKLGIDRQYSNIMNNFHAVEYYHTHTNDENREMEGIELRYDFRDEYPHIVVMSDISVIRWLEMQCSFLEMLIALCLRMERITDDLAVNWFYELVDNMGIKVNVTKNFMIRNKAMKVASIDYRPDGFLFPVEDVFVDHRDIDIWKQMAEYLIKRKD